MKDVQSYDEALHGRRGTSNDRAIKVKLPVYPGDYVSFVVQEPGEGDGKGKGGKGKGGKGGGGKDGGKGGGQSSRAVQIRKDGGGGGGGGGYAFGRGGYGGMMAEEDSTGFLDDVLSGASGSVDGPLLQCY
jgi:hypothetical protein